MYTPEDIARLISEDIHLNNGFLAEELPIEPESPAPEPGDPPAEDPRLSQFMAKDPLKTGKGGGIIWMKRGTIIEANKIYDDPGMKYVRACVGEPRTLITVKNTGVHEMPGKSIAIRVAPRTNYNAHYRLSPLVLMHPEAYKVSWVQVLDRLANQQYDRRVLSPEEVQRMIAAGRRTRGRVKVEYPFGRILTIKRENIAKIEYT